MSKLPLGSGRGSCCCASGGLLSAQTTFPDGRSIMTRSEEHTSELQSLRQLVCRLLPEKKNDGRLQREHLERKAVIEALKTRMPPEALSKLARSVLPDRSVPLHELPPQRHVPTPPLDRVSGRKVRLGKQTAVCGEVVQPRCSDHARGILRRTFLFFLVSRRPPRSTLFPYTTLFR